MKWEKLGLIFCPAGDSDRMASHAATPAVEILGEKNVRVYFSSRDRENRSGIFSLELALERASAEVIHVEDTPVLAPGESGLFDDSGVSMGCLVEADDATYLYYVGWNLGVTVPWRNSIGLAVRRRGESRFEKFSRAPVVDRGEADPFSLSYPWVLRDGKDGGWRMWYGSNLSWGKDKGDMVHAIKEGRSSDGIHWERDGSQAIAPALPEEDSVSRPCVIRDPDVYRMWYSRREVAYEIGYAESADGRAWERKDEQAGIGSSESGWDSESVEYPCVFDLEGSRYMIYNGNGYGKTGFGLAVAR